MNVVGAVGIDLEVTEFELEVIVVDLEADEVDAETIVSCLTERTPKSA